MKTLLRSIPAALTLFTCAAVAQDNMGGMRMDNPATMSMADMTKSLEPLKGKEFEIAFLTEMISHHASALDMAKPVFSHTQRPELNKLASNIIADQKKQITEMSAWLQTWYGRQADETAMAMPGMDKLTAASGAEFDKLFLSLMGEHHQGALDMAKLVATRADHAELKALAAKIIEAQTQEIAEMKGWEKSWF